MKCLLTLAVLCLAGRAALGQAPAKPELRVAPAPGPPADLARYVAAADVSFEWKTVGDPAASPEGTVYTLAMVSQTWHGFAWDHDVQIAVPSGKRVGTTALLWNQGGKAGPATAALALALANKARVPVVFLCGVPKQPLFDGKSEDALIAETFVRYLDTGDATWPLLFPMVKSVVRAIDVTQEFAKSLEGEAKLEVTHFVVTGASKRGWTAWLVGSLQDPRVKAIAPMVIDTLNFQAQMRNQLAAFGKPSQMIADYTKRGLVPIPDTERARALWAMVDPWVYREKLTVPKLVINGTNDPYWPLEGLLSYWHDLPGEKYLVVVPNAGHDLREKGENGAKQLVPERAVNALVAFARAQASGQKFPACPDPVVTPFGAGTPNGPPWGQSGAGGGMGPPPPGPPVAMGPPPPGPPVGSAPAGASGAFFTVPRCSLRSGRLWTADAPARDFRESRWKASELEVHGLGSRVGGFLQASVTVPAPDAGNRAAFLELDQQLGDLKFTLASPVFVVPAGMGGVRPAAEAPAGKPKP